MPYQDGTGPVGQGPKTGRGFGPCGWGMRRGFGRGWGMRFWPGRRLSAQDQSEMLKQEEELLEEELKAVRQERKQAETEMNEKGKAE